MLINQDKMQNICFMEQYNMDINQIRRVFIINYIES